MKYVAIVMLLVGLFWQLTPSPRSYLNFVIAAAAVFVLVQAVNLRTYGWVAAFAAIVCLFNPVVPLGISFKAMMILQIMTAAVFAVSLQLLKTVPRLTIASIIETNPETESL
jgi:hypothetical protein